MRKKQAVTAMDIARVCGVSQATVSYVINEKPGKRISAKTRELVLETAARLGYVPSASARSMRTSQAMSIGIVSGKNSISIGFNHMLRGIKQTLDPAGYTITLLNSEAEEEAADGYPGMEYLRYYLSGRIDGLLFLFYDPPTEVLRLLEERQIPYLMASDNGAWTAGQDPPQAFAQAVRQCADYCRQMGFASIRFFSLKYGDTLYSYKYDLFAAALSELYPEAALRRIIIQVPTGQTLSSEELLLRLEGYLAADDFQLAVTPNQRLGWLMQSCILKRDFMLPQRRKHICLASSHVFHLVYPTVTSIDIPLTEIGGFAAAQLLRMLDGFPLENQEFLCTLKTGMSTLC